MPGLAPRSLQRRVRACAGVPARRHQREALAGRRRSRATCVGERSSGGIEVARLDALRVGRSSARGRPACSATVPAPSVAAAATWVRSGPTVAVGAGAADRVAARARRRWNSGCALRAASSPAGRRRAARRCVRSQRVEARRRLGDHDEAPCARAGARRTRRTGRGRCRRGRRTSSMVRRGPGSGRSCRSCGTQKLWMTSSESRRARTRVPDGDVDLVGGDRRAARDSGPASTTACR